MIRIAWTAGVPLSPIQEGTGQAMMSRPARARGGAASHRPPSASVMRIEGGSRPSGQSERPLLARAARGRSHEEHDRGSLRLDSTGDVGRRGGFDHHILHPRLAESSHGLAREGVRTGIRRMDHDDPRVGSNPAFGGEPDQGADLPGVSRDERERSAATRRPAGGRRRIDPDDRDVGRLEPLRGRVAVRRHAADGREDLADIAASRAGMTSSR